MKSRKQALKTMISLIGNAAAHRALYPKSAFALREVMLYEVGAEGMAEARSRNDQEIEFFRAKTERVAANVIRNRESDHQGRAIRDLLAVAESAIEKFIAKDLRK
jgi:hypothetical protein